MKTTLLNISVFDNEWNKFALSEARKEREAARLSSMPTQKSAPNKVLSPSEKSSERSQDSKSN